MTESGERSGSGSGGREKVTEMELQFLSKILQDFDEFSANTPFNEENITDYDVLFIMEYEEIAKKFTEDTFNTQDLNLTGFKDYKNPMIFHKLKGRIKGALVEQIRTDYPKNLEFEAYKELGMDLNTMVADSVAEAVNTPEFMARLIKQGGGDIAAMLGKNGNDGTIATLKEELEEAIKKIQEQEKKIDEIKSRQQPEIMTAQTPEPQPIQNNVNHIPIPRVPRNIDYDPKPIHENVIRLWGVEANGVSGEMEIDEMRENEMGGRINVQVTDGEGSFAWSVYCTKGGQVELYDRIKGLFTIFLKKGIVESDVMYSWPIDPKSRVFAPDFSEFGIICRDNWPDNLPMFMGKYTKELTFTVGGSSWSVNIEIDKRNAESKGHNFKSAVRDFRFAAKELMEMILLSGEEVKDDVQSIK